MTVTMKQVGFVEFLNLTVVNSTLLKFQTQRFFNNYYRHLNLLKGYLSLIIIACSYQYVMFVTNILSRNILGL